MSFILVSTLGIIQMNTVYQDKSINSWVWDQTFVGWSVTFIITMYGTVNNPNFHIPQI